MNLKNLPNLDLLIEPDGSLSLVKTMKGEDDVKAAMSALGVLSEDEIDVTEVYPGRRMVTKVFDTAEKLNEVACVWAQRTVNGPAVFLAVQP